MPGSAHCSGGLCVTLSEYEKRDRRRIANRKYYKKNREVLRTKVRAWKRANPVAVAKLNARFYTNNPGYFEHYYDMHRDEYLARSKAQYAAKKLVKKKTRKKSKKAG